MWTPTARAQLVRTAEPYATCLTDAEWAIAEPFLPPAGPRGRRRRWPMRLLLDAIRGVSDYGASRRKDYRGNPHRAESAMQCRRRAAEAGTRAEGA